MKVRYLLVVSKNKMSFKWLLIVMKTQFNYSEMVCLLKQPLISLTFLHLHIFTQKKTSSEKSFKKWKQYTNYDQTHKNAHPLNKEKTFCRNHRTVVACLVESQGQKPWHSHT